MEGNHVDSSQMENPAAGAGEPSDPPPPPPTNKPVRYKGVRMRKWGSWVAEVRLPNSRDRLWLGSYPTAEKAALAYDVATYCLRGPGAAFNFPHCLPPEMPPAGKLSRAEIREVAIRHAREGRPGQPHCEVAHDGDGTGGDEKNSAVPANPNDQGNSDSTWAVEATAAVAEGTSWELGFAAGTAAFGEDEASWAGDPYFDDEEDIYRSSPLWNF